MKLKKIASLMLAGIMAVSMLAGCKTATEPTEEPEVTPVTGVAATVNNELDANKDAISFSDNSVMANLLTEYYKKNPITGSDWNAGKNTLTEVSATALYDAMNDVIGADKKISAIETAATNSNGTNRVQSEGKYTYCTIYYVNNDFVTKDNALRMVGQKIDAMNLPADNEWTDTTSKVSKGLDFAYTGDIAAIEAESKGGTESMWVIAVSITLTATNK